ncbi:MAG TPA: ABC transporter substrate-binding protein [Acetobacteraceae bacterium]|nr:ABC transporter substrate-binding protein [Acetobacteraceae bacterium]
MTPTRRALAPLLAAPFLLSRPARAEERVKVAVGQRGAWDTSVCAFGDRLDYFKDAGLTLELLYTEGGTETLQAVVSGGVDAGVGAGMLAILAASVRNAPVRILSSNFRGASDTFWYARADSGIKSFKDAGGKTVAFSTNGSSSNLVSTRLLQLAGVTTAKGVPTGNPVATLTQVLSGQIDIGYSLPPIGFPEMEQGKLVFVGSGRDVPEFRDQTVRCLIATPDFVGPRREQAGRFLQAYHRTIDWMYGDDKRVIDWFAEGAGATNEQARKARADFYPKEALRLGPPSNLALSMQQAIELKRISRALTEEQQARLIQVPWTPPA